MCGIFAVLTPANDLAASQEQLRRSWEAAESALKARGPDEQHLLQVQTDGGHLLGLGGSLLHLRGRRQPPTPLQDSSGNVLIFNGEVFGGLQIPSGANDSAELLTQLSTPGADVADILSSLGGPWALCFWQQDKQTLWVGRDALGRRSLLLCHSEEDKAAKGIVLCSVATAVQIWQQKHAQGWEQAEAGSTPECRDSAERTSDANAFWQELKPGIQSIYLGNSCSPPGSLDWQTRSYRKAWQIQLAEYHRPPDLLAASEHSSSDVHEATLMVLEAMKRAVELHSTCYDLRPGCAIAAEEEMLRPAPVLILFSGGVDSTLIAALAHGALPADEPIDLATVCFDGGESPDRHSAIDAVQELSVFAPSRQWRLIQVNASLTDIDAHRAHILGLLHPADTVMDLNIGSALWLATRAEGPMRTFIGGCEDASLPGGVYCSRARVALLGHGADEQCAGYGRHRTKFRQSGYEGLQQELRLDMQRLWLRNLGRDDRLVADHGREARHPFLDEALMKLLLSLPLPVVADLQLPVGCGDKLVLRKALSELGLPRAAARPKRAIQFGTRLGKLANIRAFGSNRGGNARHAGSLKLSEL